MSTMLNAPVMTVMAIIGGGDGLRASIPKVGPYGLALTTQWEDKPPKGHFNFRGSSRPP